MFCVLVLNPIALLEQLKHSLTLSDADKPEQLLEEVSLDGVVQFIQSGKCKNIVTLAGAGISTCEYLSKMLAASGIFCAVLRELPADIYLLFSHTLHSVQFDYLHREAMCGEKLA